MVASVVPAHSATLRRSTGCDTATVSTDGRGSFDSIVKPYCAGFRAMTIAARIIGTYSRVSRGSALGLAEIDQKSVRPTCRIARCTRPGPLLYEASAR